MIVLANRFTFSTASSASVFISFLFPVSLPALFPLWKALLPEACCLYFKRHLYKGLQRCNLSIRKNLLYGVLLYNHQLHKGSGLSPESGLIIYRTNQNDFYVFCLRPFLQPFAQLKAVYLGKPQHQKHKERKFLNSFIIVSIPSCDVITAYPFFLRKLLIFSTIAGSSCATITFPSRGFI